MAIVAPLAEFGFHHTFGDANDEKGFLFLEDVFAEGHFDSQ